LGLKYFLTKRRKFRFRLKASNNQVIGVGEEYESEADLQNGIKSVKN
jgi:uncharacterized protein YegP (UPF0339 family)